MCNFAIYKTIVGNIKIEYENDTVIYLKKVSDDIVDFGSNNKFSDLVFSQLAEFFENKRKEFDFKYELRGTNFQKKVWNALCDIPYGETRSYKDIAILIGNPKSSRAVGMANNKNPITIVVPCHRVVGSNGKLVGYAGGLAMKKKLLTIEKNCCI